MFIKIERRLFHYIINNNKSGIRYVTNNIKWTTSPVITGPCRNIVTLTIRLSFFQSFSKIIFLNLCDFWFLICRITFFLQSTVFCSVQTICILGRIFWLNRWVLWTSLLIFLAGRICRFPLPWALRVLRGRICRFLLWFLFRVICSLIRNIAAFWLRWYVPPLLFSFPSPFFLA